MKPSKVGMEESPYDYEMGGYHPVKIGDKFHENRYSVIRKLGYGQFSTVWLAHDQQQLDRHVSLKINKSDNFFTRAAEAEIQFHERTSSVNPAHRAIAMSPLYSITSSTKVLMGPMSAWYLRY
ncbi:hypothetical protein Pst134EB_021565 [Puccinia striiformis f. sp. tritici]|nr:hypothetical protein Pst134EB_021565 [Puccinia striiformis f. sp. tritici]